MKKFYAILVSVSAVLLIAVLGLVYWLTVVIATPIQFEEELAERNGKVIERIKDIRTAERQFKSKHQRFTGSFDTLINFILTEKMQGERKLVDEDDSVGMAQAYKKYGRKFKNVEKFEYSIKDSLFKHLSTKEIEELRYVPYTKNKVEFILRAAMLKTESKVVIPVVECRTPYKAYLDTVKYRQEVANLIGNMKDNFNKYPGIMFGSMERGNNEAGNWE